jgi:hypothetical protein
MEEEDQVAVDLGEVPVNILQVTLVEIRLAPFHRVELITVLSGQNIIAAWV